MPITSGKTPGLVAVGTGDTVLVTAVAQSSYEIYSGYLHSQGVAVTVELFLSPDTTSAAGERIEKIVIAIDETTRISNVVIPATYSLIAKADVTGAVFHGAYTKRTGADLN